MPIPLPVRLHDMQAVETKYLALPPEERLALHTAGAFTALLDDGERFALERRFPDELDGDPLAANASEGVKAAWDLRARELVVCMLQFGDKVITARMDLVGSVASDDDVAVLALTATGSILELDRPASDGSRRFVYRASSRPHGHRRDGSVTLGAALALGNAVELGGRRTTELLAIASGKALPPDDDFMPGTLLYGPTEDTPAPRIDHLRVQATRFRVLVDAAGNASDALRPALVSRATALAQEIQEGLGGGYTLAELRAFAVTGGARYEVVIAGRKTDLVRHHGDQAQWVYDAYIGQQRVVLDAPLVVTHHGAHSEKAVFVFRVVSIDAR